MSCRRLLTLIGIAAALSVLAPMPAAMAGGCGGWGCRPACAAPPWLGPPVVAEPVPCAARFYPPQPVYRVEQGPIYDVVVVPYEVPRVHVDYLPPRFFAD